MLADKQPRTLQIAERIIECEPTEDLVLLKEAMLLEDDPQRTLVLNVGRLGQIKEACQKYRLGKHQRLATLAIERWRL